MITKVERRARRLFVNDKPVKVWGPHTWFTLQSDEYLEGWQNYLLSVEATCDRIWAGWGPWNRTVDPDYGRREFIRCRKHIEWCLENNIVPQVSLIQGTTIQGGSLTFAHKAHIDAVLREIGDIPQVILETGNEVERASWHSQAVQYIRNRGLDQLIAVTTGGGGEVNQLENVGADILAVTDNYTGNKRLILQMDTDHNPLGSLNRNKIPALSHWVEGGDPSSGASMALLMIAREGSQISGFPGKPWNDPDNPSNQPAIEWCQDNIGTQIPVGGENGSSTPPQPPRGILRAPLEEFLFPSEDLRKFRIGNLSSHKIGNRGALVKNPSGKAIDWIVELPHGWCWLATEYLGWGDPTSYKPNLFPDRTQMGPSEIEWDPSLPPTKLWERTIDGRSTSYAFVEECKVRRSADLGGAHFEVWGVYSSDQPGLEPTREPIEGIVPPGTETIALASYYGTPNFPYPIKEEWIFCRGYGEIVWNKYEWDPKTNQYERTYRSVVNNFFNGPSVEPVFPCRPEWLDPNFIYEV